MEKKNQTSRRDFIKKGSLAGIAVSTSIVSSRGSSHLDENNNEFVGLNEKSRMLMSKFKLKYPIFQAAPGGEELAIAIANSGGMGALSLGWHTPEDSYNMVKRLNQGTNGNYYANYVLHFGTKSLDKALEAGCPTIQFSWGIPDIKIVNKVRNAGAKLGIQVSSKENASRALEHGPDFLICQGLEAGGHVQATSYLVHALPEVLKIAGDVPVLASGGISTGHDIRNALNKGAAGTILGSRFIATKESAVHDHYKKRLVGAGENDTVYTNCFNKNWKAMHRVLRNSTFLNWEAHGCPLEGNKPGEDEIIGNHPKSGPVVRYSTTLPEKDHTGELEDMVMYAGQGVPKINDLPSASELIERLWEEFENN